MLQPGTVIDAQVLKVLANNMVRIAISGLSLDVMSQVPLQAGQAMQLAVSASEGGIRLAVVGQGGAQKEQVQLMVKTLLRLQGELGADAADAIGVALCHAYAREMRAAVGSAGTRA